MVPYWCRGAWPARRTSASRSEPRGISAPLLRQCEPDRQPVKIGPMSNVFSSIVSNGYRARATGPPCFFFDRILRSSTGFVTDLKWASAHPKNCLIDINLSFTVETCRRLIADFFGSSRSSRSASWPAYTSVNERKSETVRFFGDDSRADL